MIGNEDNPIRVSCTRVPNRDWIVITVNGTPIRALSGESLTSALAAAGIETLRHTLKSGAPRGVFCGMGVCFDCMVWVEGKGHVRGCLTNVESGMELQIEET